ncbi:hypothetical protein V6N13_052086 [Hibiscus sabdariffa]|uniref:Glycosyl transferase CAP10 domain-containing protein n=1 Tax=Hibiscus sabdariffa TaxID=183260 RepID=A0ABR2T6B0_9ROSI
MRRSRRKQNHSKLNIVEGLGADFGGSKKYHPRGPETTMPDPDTQMLGHHFHGAAANPNSNMVKKQAWVHSSSHSRSPSYIFFNVVALSFLCLIGLLIYKLDNFASQTKTIVGHNLEPTPWHIFQPKNFTEESRHARDYKIIQCSYLTCRYAATDGVDQPSEEKRRGLDSTLTPPKCPNFFKFIYRDLEPWFKTRISIDRIIQTKEHAAFRIVIVEGKLFVDLYYACVQSRLMFTLWGILQLLKKYRGMVPDVDIMFDCMDKPTIDKSGVQNGSLPLPLFRYCTTEAHLDIPFPDWSFWGWSEVNIQPWDEQYKEIKQGSQAQTWAKKITHAYWKGNPDVESPIRMELMQCNDTNTWDTEIIRQVGLNVSVMLFQRQLYMLVFHTELDRRREGWV